MKSEGKEKKGFFFALLAAVIVIWGYNMYQIAVGVQSGTDGPPAVPPGAETLSSGSYLSERTSYRGAFRDPFEPPRRLQPAASPASSQHAEPSPPVDPSPPEQVAEPSYHLSGIIGKTAIIQTSEGAVYVVAAGERVAEARLRQIGANYVVLEYGRKRITLTLPDE